jgi:hypothetical protein
MDNDKQLQIHQALEELYGRAANGEITGSSWTDVLKKKG